MCCVRGVLMVVDDVLCSYIWGGSAHCYSYRLFVGASGDLLTVWDSFVVESSSSGSSVNN